MSCYILKDSQKVYEHLADEESKRIFECRVMYSMTRNYQYIYDIIENLQAIKNTKKILKSIKYNSERLIVYGCGRNSVLLKRFMPEIDFYCYCDCDIQKQKSGWQGKKVISKEELMKAYPDYSVLIILSLHHNEIRDNLLAMGKRESQIIDIGGVLNEVGELQYFDPEIVKPLSDEIFIDGGCCDCTTDRQFIKWCNGQYEKIIAFEPDDMNYQDCLRYLRKEPIERIEIINKGLWDSQTTLSFAMEGQGTSRIVEGTENNMVQIMTTSIDDIMKGKRVSFIKMDIEGAEMNALIGAQDTIKRYHPKLAICIYHKLEDVITIPAYILSLHSDYKLYMRHYYMSDWETVLYAV